MKKHYEVHLCIDGVRQLCKIHRLVAQEFIENPDPEQKIEVDHIDKDPANNCVSNLRWSSSSENKMNRRKCQSNRSSKFKGVSWNCRKTQCEARIIKDKRKYHLGYFHDEKDAARAYNERAMELLGEYAHLNDISDDDEEVAISDDNSIEDQ